MSLSPVLRPYVRRVREGVGLALDHGLELWLALIAAASIVIVCKILFLRWDFPAEIEWMEGGSLAHVARIANGDALYVAPTPEWVPFIYHPAYYYASLVATWFLGMGLPALRLVSVLGFLASLFGLGKLTWDATRSPAAALAAPAFYAASFELGGSWFDIARVDSFVQGVLMLGLLAIRGRSRKAQMTAAALFYVCFMGKQIAVLLFAPAVLWALFKRGREAWYAAFALAAVSGLTVAYLHYSTGGWYWYYCIELPRSHPFVDSMWVDFWRVDLELVWPTLAASAFLIVWAFDHPRRPKHVWLVLGVLAGGLLVGLFSRLHAGGFLNVLLPTFAALGLAFGVVIGHAQSLRRELGWAALALGIFQLNALYISSEMHVPTPEDWQAAADVQEAIDAIEGDIYAPESSSYMIVAGHEPRPQAVAVEDILRGGGPAPREAFLSALGSAIEERRYEAILLNDLNIAGSTLDVLQRGYRPTTTVHGPRTRTGMWTRVNRIMTPR